MFSGNMQSGVEARTVVLEEDCFRDVECKYVGKCRKGGFCNNGKCECIGTSHGITSPPPPL